MATVTPLHRDPLEFVTQEAQGHDLQACALIGINTDGQYVLTSAGASPEECLMMAEILRQSALEMTQE